MRQHVITPILSTMKPRFEPDDAAGLRPVHSTTLIDPEAYDASEQQFAASLDQRPFPRFIVDEQGQKPPALSGDRQSIKGASAEPLEEDSRNIVAAPAPEANGGAEERATSHPQTNLEEEHDHEGWRQEVAARLNNYRARRRPRAPRYPSLRLKFETSDPGGTVSAVQVVAAAPAIPARQAVALKSDCMQPSARGEINDETAGKIYEAACNQSKISESRTWERSKLIEFPRPAAAPLRIDALAEPVFDRPRILEVPDVVPPPPALGGIMIEQDEELPHEKRPGFEIPLQAAPMSRRLAAVAIDSVLVFSSVALFAYIFFRITRQLPSFQPGAGIMLVVVGVSWAVYQYLLLIHCGTTPGLELAGLRLCRFDGEPVPRRVRRWRVLASVLSGLSLALGYAWCFLDEDQLCWHDRITHTYMAPKT